MDFLF